MAIHELKTFYPYWDAVNEGRKTFEVRKNDRNFQLGDIFHLRRTTKDGKEINNYFSPIKVKIVYLLAGEEFGIRPGFVVLGIKKIN